MVLSMPRKEEERRRGGRGGGETCHSLRRREPEAQKPKAMVVEIWPQKKGETCCDAPF